MKQTIKGEVIPVNPTRNNSEYPYLGLGRKTSCVVQFTGPNQGHLVLDGDGKYYTGQRSMFWDETTCKPLPKGTVIKLIVQ